MGQQALPVRSRGGTREETRMLEIGLFHNGASSLPVITNKDGWTFNEGSLPEVHQAAQETLVNQVRQGILAEKLGFQSFWLTEHHFQPEGAEMSPNPARSGGQHNRLAPPGPARPTDRAARRDQRRAGSVRGRRLGRQFAAESTE